MEYHVRLEQIGSRPLAVVRRLARAADLAKVIPAACGTVWGVVRAQQVLGAGRNVVVYLDCRDGQIDLEVGVELDDPFAGHGEVIPSAVPTGWAATTTHYGPYGQLHGANDAILSWCRNNGHTPAGPSWEVYGHWKDEWNHDPAQVRTDVFYLLTTQRASTAEPGTAPDPAR